MTGSICNPQLRVLQPKVLIKSTPMLLHEWKQTSGPERKGSLRPWSLQRSVAAGPLLSRFLLAHICSAHISITFSPFALFLLKVIPQCKSTGTVWFSPLCLCPCPVPISERHKPTSCSQAVWLLGALAAWPKGETLFPWSYRQLHWKQQYPHNTKQQ